MTLDPFVSYAGKLIIPANLTGPVVSLFGRRVVEIGVKSVAGEALRVAIEAAVATERWDVIDYVFEIGPGAHLYRIMLPEGPYYPLVRDGAVACTMYRQSDMSALRHGRSQRKKHTGQRANRVGRRRACL